MGCGSRETGAAACFVRLELRFHSMRTMSTQGLEDGTVCHRGLPEGLMIGLNQTCT